MSKMLGAVLAVPLLAGVAAAGAASSDPPPDPHFLSPRAQDVQGLDSLVGNSRGDTLAVWTEYAARGHARLWLRDRRRGHRFAEARALNRPRADGYARTAAVGEDGTEVVAWVSRALRAHETPLRVAVRRPGHGFSHSRILDANGAYEVALAVASDGRVMAVWSKLRGGRPAQLSAALLRADGSWSRLGEITSGRWDAADPRVAFDSSGAATVVWQRIPPQLPEAEDQEIHDRQVAFSYRANGGRFTRPRVLSRRGHDAREPVLAQNAAGDTGVLWISMGDLLHSRLGFAVRRAGGRFGPPRWLTPASGFAGPVFGGMDPKGDLTAVWERTGRRKDGYLCSCGSVVAARRPAGGAFGRAAPVAPSHGQLDEADANAAGDMLVVWHVDLGERHGYRRRLGARVMHANGSSGARVDVAGPSDIGDVHGVLRGDRTAFVGWVRVVRGRDPRARVEAVRLPAG